MTKPSDIRPKKPTTAVKAMQAAADAEKQAPVKRPFVRKEHLTHRPFVDPKLAELRGSLEKKGRA